LGYPLLLLPDELILNESVKSKMQTYFQGLSSIFVLKWNGQRSAKSWFLVNVVLSCFEAD